MLRRIDNLDAVTERKKNRFDTSVYPALLLRRREEMHPTDLLDYQLAAAAARAARRPASARAGRAAQTVSSAARHAAAEAIADERLRARAQREVRAVTARTERAVGMRPSSASAAGRRGSAPHCPLSAGPLPRGARGAAAGSGRRVLSARNDVTEYDEYARDITAAIIADRIYHEDDLRKFLRRALDDPRHAHLDRVKLKARTDEIAADFFCRLD